MQKWKNDKIVQVTNHDMIVRLREEVRQAQKVGNYGLVKSLDHQIRRLSM